MKKIIWLMLACLLANHGFGQARPGSYPWNVSLRIVDDNGLPIEGAKTWVGFGSRKVDEPTDPFLDPLQSGQWAIAGFTDVNGSFTASHTDKVGTLGIYASKAGYYSSHVDYQLYLPGQLDENTVSSNRNPNLTLVLKLISKPVALYSKAVNLGLPVFDKPAGYDFMIGDWVSPYGAGVTTDIIFTAHREKRAANDTDYKLIVSFPNAGDGLKEFIVPDTEVGSQLRSPHEVPSEGYQSGWVQTKTRRPGKSLESNVDPGRNYFFRVRTALDHQGNVVSAHYGKIYGDFMNFKYYLNPTPDSRNVEFDPKQNLIHNLKFDEAVDMP